ncbi:hypothetical protein DVR12_11225 [Chitinophaga silvatica]|uniref:LTD domain-containing protein n=1 Tax=Chitinophaga silvatica TaxID=2282649 RepID=A0A3E1Y9N1_9BACT|nr:lamin tail domain-containing protein [Chitinophaga silvatica]RFS22378.1 hypothetical protein DVR12_11225 [Chitinophaga silvatica]
MRLPVVCSLLVLICCTAFSQNPEIYDVVIHEVLPKPTPVLALPPYEYIELYNRSVHSYNLENWQLKVNSRTVSLPAYLLKPDSLIVFCSVAGAEAYHQSNIVGISRFPAISDDTALITLFDSKHKVIHAIDYNQGWYGSVSKNGKSLEMIDIGKPCYEKANWLPSSSSTGGTPGTMNSVHGQWTDDSRPDLLYAVWLDSLTIRLLFSKSLDSSIATNPTYYKISPDLPLKAIKAVPPLFKEVDLSLLDPVYTEVLYQITTNGLLDCTGKESDLYNTTILGKGKKPQKGNIVINELLVNPSPGIPKFIEVYNRSDKPIALDQLYFSSRKKDGSLSTFRKLAVLPRILPASDYLAFTTNAEALCQHFICKAKDKIATINSLPTMAMDEGSVILLSADSTIIDDVRYSDSLFFPLMTNNRDVSIERLSPEQASDISSNWHTASNIYNGATPGFENSQRWVAAVNPPIIAIQPALITPDLIIDNKAILSWELPQPGYVGNVNIYDIQGKLVRQLARNILLGNSGNLSWNGTNEASEILPSGVYIFLIEIFNLQGSIMRWKRTVTLARKLK